MALLPPRRGRSLVCLVSTLALAVASFVVAQPPAHADYTDDFIAKVAPMAQQGEREHKVPASVSIAQAIIESGWGRSKLTVEANSFFGIKCFATVSPYQNGCYSIETKEYRPDGSSYTTVAKFRKYDTPAKSFMDHGLFLRTNSRYAAAFNYTANPERFIHEVHKAGYATDPEYASSIIAVIQRYDLNRYNVTPRSNAVLAPSVFGTANRTVVQGSKQTFIVSYYADPANQRSVVWQESRDGGRSWRNVTIRAGLDSLETYGYRARYTRTIGADNGVLLRAQVSNSKGAAYSTPAKLTVTQPAPVTPTPTPVPQPISITRMGGADRYETSVAMARSQFASGSSPVVYVANGLAYSDALTGAAAAAQVRGALLLLAPTSIPAIVRAELTRLKPSRIVVQGGRSVVPPSVEAQLKAYAPVIRNDGKDRYEVALNTARQAFPTPVRRVFITTALNYPDALSAANLFESRLGPVVLVDPVAGINAQSLALLKQLGTVEATILGGPRAVPESTRNLLANRGITVTRLGGTTIYDTSLSAATQAYPKGASRVYVTTSADFADGLAIGPIAARKPGPVLLVTRDCMPRAMANWVRSIKPSEIVITGGPKAVTDAVGRLNSCSW